MRLPDERLSAETLDWLLDKAAEGEVIVSGTGSSETIDRIIDVVVRLGRVPAELRREAQSSRVENNERMDGPAPEES